MSSLSLGARLLTGYFYSLCTAVPSPHGSPVSFHREVEVVLVSSWAFLPLQPLSSLSSNPRSRPAQQPAATAHPPLLLGFSVFPNLLLPQPASPGLDIASADLPF